jgi:hypothetical protein
MSRIRLRWLAALVFLGLTVSVPQAGAAKVKVWHHHTSADYAKAQFHKAVVSSEGEVRLARKLTPLATLDVTHIWDLAEDAGGNLFAATGDEGKLFKITPNGHVSVIYTCPKGQILCLSVGVDGAVYAGTGPAGQVVRIDPRGTAKVLCELGAAYVWSLAADARTGELYAGTGPKGRLWRIAPEGKASVLYTTRQDHVLAVAVGGDGSLYAGTDKSGLVYRIDSQGKGFVLFQAPQAEVRALQVTADAVYAGTSSPPGKRRFGGSSGGSLREVSALLSDSDVSPAASKAGLRPVAEFKKAAGSEDHDPTRGHTAPAPSAPASGENSVYRIRRDGSIREVFRDKGLVLSLLHGEGHCFVGTGMEGRLFEVHEASRERSEVARLDHGQVLCLRRRKDNAVVVGTGDPGKLYLLEDKFSTSGTVTSEVLDAKLASKWGELSWQAETPPGTRVSVALRSGNISEPDETWSDWSAEKTGGAADAAVPPARFVQYRITLATDSPVVTPAVRAITLRYANTNQAPEVLKIEVPDLNSVNLDNPKKLRIKWTSQDANEDDLTYVVFVRKEGWPDWVLLDDDLDKPEFEWETTTTPSGVYRLKVVASDRKDNPDGEALSGERVSAPFVVCHSAPKVSVSAAGSEGSRASFVGRAASPLVRLIAASYAVDGKKWVNAFPASGLFDSASKDFAFAVEGLKPGTHVLVLRVRDAAGNIGSADVVFEVKK